MRVAILTTDNREHHRNYVALAPYFGPAIEALLEGLAGRSDLEVHVISCSQRPMSSPEKLAENMWFHLLVVPKIGWLRTAYQGCIRAIRKKLHEIEPDIVHGQGTERECALAAVFSGFPNVLTLLGNMREVARKMHALPGSFLWCAALLEGFALRRSGGVLCNSSYTASLVSPVARRTWTVANALRGQFLDSPPSGQRSNRTPAILNIGAIIPYKRQNELLQSARRLHNDGHRFELLFIGDAEAETPYAARFRESIASAAKQGFARHLGSKSTPELIELLDQGSALVHLSTEESFGLVVAEGLARNLKFFGTAAGGIIDIAAGVEGAELFAPGEELKLETAIARWLAEGCPRPKSAASEMRARYHPEVIAKEHLHIYRAFAAEVADDH